MKRVSVRRLAGFGGASLALLAGWLARQRDAASDFSGLLWLWVVGVIWFLLAFAPPDLVGRVRRRLGRLRTQRIELMGLAALLAVALIVRAVDLEHIPPNLGGDEGEFALEGLAMLDSRVADPFATRWFHVPAMSFLAWGLSMRLLGDTVAGVRGLSALIGTAAVLTTFLLARELWGRRMAWLAAGFLACGGFHLHYSRLAVNNVADSFLVTLSLWLLVRGMRRASPLYFALAGAVTGLGWYGYVGAQLMGIVLALYLAWRAVAERRFLPRYGRSLLVLLAGAAVVVAPLLFYYLEFPDTFLARYRQINIFSSGWLEREQVFTGRSAASLLVQQFWRSVSAFNYTLDPTYWYRDTIPLLDFVGGALFVVGLLWSVAYWFRPANGLLLLWFWSMLVLGSVVAENPPGNSQMLVIAPALAVLAGLGLNWLIELGRRLFGGTSRRWSVVAAVVLAVVAVTGLHRYFFVYTPRRIYGNPTAEVATELARYVAQQSDDSVVYFYAPATMYWDFGTLRFMARGVTGMDVLPPEEGGRPEPDLARGARFVFLPHRLGELQDVRTRFPGGVERPVFSTGDGRLLYVLYEVVPPD